jgi:O-antigen ligase
MSEVITHDPSPALAMPAPARPAWARPPPCLALAMLALSAIVLMSKGSLFALPGAFEHVPKLLELIALGAVGYEVARGRIPPTWPLPLSLGLLYVLHAVVSGLWAPYQDSFLFLIVKLLHAVLLAPILCLACTRVGDLTLALVVFKACSFVCALVAIAQRTLPFLQIDALAEGNTMGDAMGMGLMYAEELSSGAIVRASGTLGHSNALSLFLAGSLFLQPWLWKRFPGRRARALLLVVTVAEGLAMLFTYGRLGMIAMAVAGAWMLARGGVRRPFFALSVAFATFAVTLPVLPATWVERVLDPSHFGKSDSIAGRMELQVYGWQLVQKHGLVGGGYGQFGQLFYREAEGYLKETVEYLLGHTGKAIDIDDLGAHNVYLEVLVEQGLLGLVLFCGAGLAVVWQLVRLSRATPAGSNERLLCITLECVVIAFAVASIFIHTQEMKVMWIALGLACAWLRIGGAVAARRGASR